MKENTRCRIYVSGIVQGVFFRSHTHEVAQRLGLKGWVKNLRDGRVEIVVEGPKDIIEKLIQWCNKGPPHARVDNIETHWEDTKDEFSNFEILYS